MTLSEAMRYNNECMCELEELKEYHKSVRRQWRFSRDAHYLVEVRRILSYRRKLDRRLSESSDSIHDLFIEEGKVLPASGPQDNFDLRRWCIVNNYAKKYFSACVRRFNVLRFHQELGRRRRANSIG
jgi:hypothetical protein